MRRISLRIDGERKASSGLMSKKTKKFSESAGLKRKIAVLGDKKAYLTKKRRVRILS
ncbi:hypothetical protein ES702_03824 [subsurface metagenome]